MTPERQPKLDYSGCGENASLSLVPFPANFSFSITDMPSSGTIYKLPWAGATLTLDELKGAFVMWGFACDFGPGWGKSLMFLGGNRRAGTIASAMPIGAPAMQIASLLVTSNACVSFGGMSATVLPANIGATCYLGEIS